MVTGKVLAASEFLRFAQDLGSRLRLETASTWRRLAGGCPQWPQRLPYTSRCFPGNGRNAAANWRQQLLRDLRLRMKRSRTTNGLSTRLEECPRMLLRGVNSMDKPNGRLVLVSYTHYCASTSSLSTRWSFWALQGDLILERASRLYAFSGYHNRTSLPSRALGRTTGTQEVRPSRSSRTKDSPPQISYAHSR